MNKNTPTRGIRNKNPLNIRHSCSRWKGLAPEQTDKAFCRFVGFEYGFRAAVITLRTYITKHRANSIEKIVYRWCPPGDGANDPERYIRDVCRLTQMGGKDLLMPGDSRLKEIVWAMAQIESGRGILEHRESLERGYQMTLSRELSDRDIAHGERT